MGSHHNKSIIKLSLQVRSLLETKFYLKAAVFLNVLLSLDMHLTLSRLLFPLLWQNTGQKWLKGKCWAAFLQSSASWLCTSCDHTLTSSSYSLDPTTDGCSSSTVSQNKAFSLQFLLLTAFYHLRGSTALGRQRQADLVYKASSRRTARTITQRNAISKQSINQSINQSSKEWWKDLYIFSI